MNKEIIIEVPRDLKFIKTIRFVQDFNHYNEEACYIFDFKNSLTIDPFSLLYLSDELSVFKSKNNTSKFYARDWKHLSYHAHMGFFKSFGLNYGKEPGEAEGSGSYYPIEIISVSDIRETLDVTGVEHAGELLDQYAGEISTILTQNGSKIITDVLRYSIREILRNIVEHSQSESFSFCAQYLRKTNKVYFAVLDKGVGLKATLSKNPKLNLEDDSDALKWCIKPGVSGKVYPGQKRKPKDVGLWNNSGYGLYMTSNISSLGGAFFISSGCSGLFIKDKEQKFLEMNTHGTAVYLSINVNEISKIESIEDLLSTFRKDTPKNVFLPPSASSMDKL